MPTLYTHIDKNIKKTWFLICFFLVFIIGLGWVFARSLETPAILYIAVIFSILMSLLSYWRSDKIILGLSQAKEVKHDEMPELYHIVENLCITAGLPLPKIYLINDPSPNAFATGRNPKHAVIAVTAGLLQKLERSELEGVIAHEMAHIGNRDTLLMTVVVILVGFVALLSHWFIRFSFYGQRGRSRQRGQIGVIIVLVGIILALLSPIISQLIQLAISRKREFLADASGALLTRYPDGLARALEKISVDPNPVRVANNATAHLYIAEPRKKRLSGWTRFFSTHPPVEERVKALRGMRV